MQQSMELERLILEGRKRLSMSGVESVDGFSSQQIKLSVGGNKVIILGSEMKITAFNKGNGNLSAEGSFQSIRYDVKKGPIIKRIFK